jgi:hypothetical protein
MAGRSEAMPYPTPKSIRFGGTVARHDPLAGLPGTPTVLFMRLLLLHSDARCWPRSASVNTVSFGGLRANSLLLVTVRISARSSSLSLFGGAAPAVRN